MKTRMACVLGKRCSEGSRWQGRGKFLQLGQVSSRGKPEASSVYANETRRVEVALEKGQSWGLLGTFILLPIKWTQPSQLYLYPGAVVRNQ